nr:hypothetical protein FQY85_21685 [Cronobacter turicensis]
MTRHCNTFSKSIKTQRNQPVALTEIFSGFLAIVLSDATPFQKLITLLRGISEKFRICGFLQQKIAICAEESPIMPRSTPLSWRCFRPEEGLCRYQLSIPERRLALKRRS